jgi:hypothetical protein
MKTVSTYKFLLAILAIGAVVAAVWTSEASGRTPKEWQPLPKLVYQECITAERSVQANPFSGISDDFVVVTKYEEYGQGGPVINKKPEATGNTEELNIYLLVGAYLAEEQPIVLVLHDISLVVTERITNTRPDAKLTLRRWILLDKDADGVLDKAVFSEKGEGEGGAQPEVEIPSDQLATLQGYFDQAVGSINKRAAEGSANACTQS